VLLAVVGFFVYRGLAGASTISVPNVYNQPVAVAKDTIQNAGLGVKGTNFALQSSLPEGHVVSTTPQIGMSVKPGTKVVLTLSRGPLTNVTVPTVTGQSIGNAELTLNVHHLGYVLAPVPSWNQPALPGTVLAQKPLATSQVPSGTVVTLTVLSQGGTFPLPDVTGQPSGTASGTLGQYGLNVGSSSQQCSSSQATGNVVSTNPPATTPVAAGDLVSLVLSSGACPVTVPYVQGLPASEASPHITAASLQPVIVNCPTGPSTNIVATQSPAGYSMATPGSPVNLYLTCASTTTTTTTQPGGQGHGRHHHHRK
jgi:beta-lactam-binding protein with PASTA domain